jgi:hypothetical protein
MLFNTGTVLAFTSTIELKHSVKEVAYGYAFAKQR